MEIKIDITPISQKKDNLEVKFNGEPYSYETPYGDEDLKTDVFHGQVHEIVTEYIDRIFQNEILNGEEMRNRKDFSINFKFVEHGNG